jgi:hypothetical protein
VIQSTALVLPRLGIAMAVQKITYSIFEVGLQGHAIR